MDFRNRGVPGQQAAPGSTSSTSSKFRGRGLGKWLERGPAVLLFSVAIVIAALTAMLFLSDNATTKAIIKDKYQAVFLNNGQVYFGNIRGISDRSVTLQNIYYLQTNNANGETTTNTSTNVSLVKLGCELHGPYDQMIINSQQILFWENLQDSSQVVKAIDQYKKDNPKGQTCSNTSQNSTQQAPTTGGQGQPAAGGNSTATPPATQTPPATTPQSNTNTQNNTNR